MIRATGGVGNLKVAFVYAYMGRRVAKQIRVWDPAGGGGAGAWSDDPADGAYVRKFVWAGWLMLMELDSSGGTGRCGTEQCGTGYQPVRFHTWGLDLAGQNRHSAPSPFQGEGRGEGLLQAAGGIGGLLAVHQAALDRPGTINDVAAGDYGFTYDGNGNVVQVVDLQNGPQIGFTWHAARLMALYEYDAYGNVIGPDTSGDGQFDELDAPGHYAAENPMRFSTKYFDRATGLGNWGYRYYSPGLGRWISRDPLEELGGANYYAYVMNGPVARFDARGLCVLGLTCGGNPFGPWGWPPYPEPDGPRMGGASRPLPGDEDTCEEGGPWDFPDCSDTPDCALACALGEAGGAAICYQDSPDSAPRPCTCDCYRVRERIREEAPGTYPPHNPPSKKGEDLVRRCIRHEEQRDAKNLPCYKGSRPKGSDTQCPGDIEQLKCLKGALRECGADRACKDMLYAQAKKQVAGCVTYGPNNPNRSGAYQRPCPPNEVTDCQNAFVDFEDEYLSGQGSR